ncbi:MAG: polyprenyl synthetase family protein [Candidatus Omnitrophica bacterium]|nr:polyprenyl synthetase family protein [Candidatus Omnitrophota bacterium]
MMAENRIKQNRKLIDKALKTYLGKASSSSGDVLSAMKYALFPGGKRLRPILCLESSMACGANIKSAIAPACAIEFIHNFSLIHDDLPAMDNDSIRRGRPACHVKFGEGIAILAGDALLNLAFMIISDMRNKKIALKLIKTISYSIGLNGMIGGQGLDIKRKGNIGESRINDLKTGMLFACSLSGGAIAASAPSAKIRALEKFGKDFGSAYQIYDDLKDNTYQTQELEKKRTKLKKILNRTKSSLEIFGRKADNLRYIADKLERKSLRS